MAAVTEPVIVPPMASAAFTDVVEPVVTVTTLAELCEI
jgi:hypothetical protein